MNTETVAGHAVSVMSEAARYDAAVKQLLAHKPFLARIMKECLAEYRDSSIDDIMNRYIEGDPHVASIGVHVDETNPRIRGGNAEDRTLTEGTVYYDIRFNALVPSDDDTIGIIINIEAQNKAKPGYSLLKRAIYYCSRMISAQKGVEFNHSDYDRIKKVYSIWVCSDVPEAEKATITAYSMKETHLVGEVIKEPDEYDLLSVVMIRLADVPQCMDGSVDEEKLDDSVIGMLEVLLKGDLTAVQRKSLLEKRYGIEMTEQIEEGVGHMCNLSQGVMERGFEKGIAQGIEEGIEKGIAQGRTQGAAQATTVMLKKAMEKNGWSLEAAMRFFDLPLDDMELYASEMSRG